MASPELTYDELKRFEAWMNKLPTMSSERCIGIKLCQIAGDVLDAGDSEELADLIRTLRSQTRKHIDRNGEKDVYADPVAERAADTIVALASPHTKPLTDLLERLSAGDVA